MNGLTHALFCSLVYLSVSRQLSWPIVMLLSYLYFPLTYLILPFMFHSTISAQVCLSEEASDISICRNVTSSLFFYFYNFNLKKPVKEI